jgi:hypothetical protein
MALARRAGSLDRATGSGRVVQDHVRGTWVIESDVLGRIEIGASEHQEAYSTFLALQQIRELVLPDGLEPGTMVRLDDGTSGVVVSFGVLVQTGTWDTVPILGRQRQPIGVAECFQVRGVSGWVVAPDHYVYESQWGWEHAAGIDDARRIGLDSQSHDWVDSAGTPAAPPPRPFRSGHEFATVDGSGAERCAHCGLVQTRS